MVFAATGVTPGETLKGVEYFRGGARTLTWVMSAAPRVVRFMDTIHVLEPEAGLQGSSFDKRNTSKTRGVAAFVNQEE